MSSRYPTKYPIRPNALVGHKEACTLCGWEGGDMHLINVRQIATALPPSMGCKAAPPNCQSSHQQLRSLRGDAVRPSVSPFCCSQVSAYSRMCQVCRCRTQSQNVAHSAVIVGWASVRCVSADVKMTRPRRSKRDAPINLRGRVARREQLRGMLNFYHREAA